MCEDFVDNSPEVHACDNVLVMASQRLHSPASPCVNAAWTLKVRETEIDTVIDSSPSFSAK